MNLYKNKYLNLYKNKYLKYKQKYLILQKQIGGGPEQLFLYDLNLNKIIIIPKTYPNIIKNDEALIYKDKIIYNIAKNFFYINIKNTIIILDIVNHKFKIINTNIQNKNSYFFKGTINNFDNLKFNPNTNINITSYSNDGAIENMLFIPINIIINSIDNLSIIFIELHNLLNSSNEKYANKYNIDSHILKLVNNPFIPVSCNKDKLFIELILHYFYNKIVFNIPINVFNCFIKDYLIFEYYINYLIKSEYETTPQKMNDICTNKLIYYNHMYKRIPKKINCNEIQIENKSGSWIQFPDFDDIGNENIIIFDTGNESNTLIGENIVKKLDLIKNLDDTIVCIPANKIPKTCIGSVQIKIRLKNFSLNEYIIKAYIDTDSPNQILFGWGNNDGLSKFSADKFLFTK